MRGIAQAEAHFGGALRGCGTADENGNTIGIVNVKWTGLRWIPLGLRLLGLLILIMLFFFKHPLGFLPGDSLGIEWMSTLEHWEAFSTGTWLLAICLYLVYLVASVVRSSYHRGVPGIDTHFSRYGKVVKIVTPGSAAIISDPRVQPSSVISRKVMMIELDPVEGIGVENIKMTTRGTLVIRVTDSFRLFEQGGFEKLIQQLQSDFRSIQQDRILQSSARRFNQYMVEPAHYRKTKANDIDERLTKLEGTQLSVSLVTELSEIDEVDVSAVDLAEPENCARRSIIPALQVAATRYGVEILDYLPQGNLTDRENIQTLAIPLVQSIQRLRQASEMLQGVLKQEIDEEITARVAHRQRGLLEITQLCSELESVQETLKDTSNREAIINASISAMRSKVSGITAQYLGKVEALTAQIEAKQIDTAGIELYFAELDELLSKLRVEVEEAIPRVTSMIVDSMDKNTIVPEVDLIGAIISSSGIMEKLDKLKESAEKSADPEALAQVAKRLSEEADQLDSDVLVRKIQEELDRIKPSSGIDTERYAPEKVSVRIDEISGRVAEAEHLISDQS